MSESLLNPRVFDVFPTIETERLVLREFREDDVDELYRQRTDREVRQYVSKPLDPDKEFTLNMIKEIIQSFKDKKGLNWVIEHKETGKWMGSFGFWNIMLNHGRAEIGYSLNKEFWRQGYMYEVLKTCLPFAFEKAGIHTVMACTDPRNEASWKLLEKLGFRREAHHLEDWYFDGKFYDTLVYGLLERDLKVN